MPNLSKNYDIKFPEKAHLSGSRKIKAVPMSNLLSVLQIQGYKSVLVNHLKTCPSAINILDKKLNYN